MGGAIIPGGLPVGIDLGSAATKAATWHGGGSGPAALRPMPSCTWTDPAGGETAVGREALRHLADDSAPVCWPLEVLRDGPAGDDCAPVAAISWLIRAMLERASGASADPQAPEVALALPPEFSLKQIDAVTRAAARAGAGTISTWTAPQLVSLHVVFEEQMREGLFLVYDLGAGFSVSLVRVTGGVCDLIMTRGDRDIGGRCFDRRVTERLMEQIQARTTRTHSMPSGELLLAAERLRVRLSSEPVSATWLPDEATPSGGVTLELARNELEALIAEPVSRTLQLADSLMADASHEGVRGDHLDAVILAGAASLTPHVQQRVAQWASARGRMPLAVLSERPQMRAALGAAVAASGASVSADGSWRGRHGAAVGGEPRPPEPEADSAITDAEIARLAALALGAIRRHETDGRRRSMQSAWIERCAADAESALRARDRRRLAEIAAQLREFVERWGGPDDAGAAGEKPDVVSRVEFTAFYPQEVAAGRRHILRAYVHMPGTHSQVIAEAREQMRLPEDTELRAGHAHADRPVSRAAELMVVPDVPGLSFSPRRQVVGLRNETQFAQFSFEASPDLAGRACEGTVMFLLTGILIGEVPVGVLVRGPDEHADFLSEFRASEPSRAYQAVFISYSHQDSEIVKRHEEHIRARGDRFIRDQWELRSGEEWSPRLLELIDEADVFQLFWSPPAAESKYVKCEWTHALRYQTERPCFIRPVYWQSPAGPQPEPPPELAHIHFTYAQL